MNNSFKTTGNMLRSFIVQLSCDAIKFAAVLSRRISLPVFVRFSSSDNDATTPITSPSQTIGAAHAYDTLPHGKQCFTSVFINAAGSDPAHSAKNYTASETEILFDRLKNAEFDFIRDDSGFISLIERYDTKQSGG